MLLMTVNFNQFSESKCLGANKNGNSPALNLNLLNDGLFILLFLFQVVRTLQIQM